MTDPGVQRPVSAADAPALHALMSCPMVPLLLSVDLQTADMVVNFVRAVNLKQWAFPRLVMNGESADAMLFMTDVDLRNLSGRLVAIPRDLTTASTHIERYVRDLLWCLPYHRVGAMVPSSLHELRAAFQKAGFREEGAAREYYVSGGELEDACIFGLLRTEFFDSQREMA